MVQLRATIVAEATRGGLFEELEDSKRRFKEVDYAFRHHTMSSALKIAKAASDAVGHPEKARWEREKAGKLAVEA